MRSTGYLLKNFAHHFGTTRAAWNPPTAEASPTTIRADPEGSREEKQEWMRQKQLKKRRQTKGVAERK